MKRWREKERRKEIKESLIKANEKVFCYLTKITQHDLTLKMSNQKKKKNERPVGSPGWLSWLGLQFLVLARVMISRLWDWALFLGAPHSVDFSPFPSAALYHIHPIPAFTLILSLSQIFKKKINHLKLILHYMLMGI